MRLFSHPDPEVGFCYAYRPPRYRIDVMMQSTHTHTHVPVGWLSQTGCSPASRFRWVWRVHTLSEDMKKSLHSLWKVKQEKEQEKKKKKKRKEEEEEKEEEADRCSHRWTVEEDTVPIPELYLPDRNSTCPGPWRGRTELCTVCQPHTQETRVPSVPAEAPACSEPRVATLRYKYHLPFNPLHLTGKVLGVLYMTAVELTLRMIYIPMVHGAFRKGTVPSLSDFSLSLLAFILWKVESSKASCWPKNVYCTVHI